MNLSVAIPTYNSSETIRATLDSVLNQTEPADEILILDDGSTDATLGILESYGSRVTVIKSTNRGVAQARNELCARAKGDLIAFLDHDDCWHPEYLKTQRWLLERFPHASALFTGHHTFYGSGAFQQWGSLKEPPITEAEEIGAVQFIKRYHEAIGAFMSMSFCCVPKAALQRFGDNPFCREVSGVDDCYILHRLALVGPVIYFPENLAAYRITKTAQSADRVKGAGLSVRAMELLKPQFLNTSNVELRRVFQWAMTTQRREYGKVLMAASRIGSARGQFLMAIVEAESLPSLVKSLGLLLFSMMPSRLQPKWLPIQTAT